MDKQREAAEIFAALPRRARGALVREARAVLGLGGQIPQKLEGLARTAWFDLMLLTLDPCDWETRQEVTARLVLAAREAQE